MKLDIVDIAQSHHYQLQAAEILIQTFIEKGICAWPDMESAEKEVRECIEQPNITVGLATNGELSGWVGLRPMYEKTWELHPMVVRTDQQNKGIGRILLDEVEKKARQTGLIGIVLGTDDENERTSISKVDIQEENLLETIANIKNLNRHPFEFYKKCGYMITGIVPNANGRNRPDIWMWKSLM